MRSFLRLKGREILEVDHWFSVTVTQKKHDEGQTFAHPKPSENAPPYARIGVEGGRIAIFNLASGT